MLLKMYVLYIYMRLDQRSRCNKFFCTLSVFLFTHIIIFMFFFHVVYSCISFSSSISFMLFMVVLWYCCCGGGHGDNDNSNSNTATIAAVVLAAFFFFDYILFRYMRILRILKYIEAKNGQIHSKTVMRINSFRK